MNELSSPTKTAVLGWWLSLAAVVSVVPLVVFGSSVTTLGAGMAVEGWLVAEGHFLVLFPIDSWFRDTGTFVEHTHRLCGVLVGLFAIGACLASWLGAASRAARWGSLIALLAICIQGTIGGFRVLEASPQLAFLHGALAQAVFAIVAVAALLQSPAWRSHPGRAQGTGAARLGLLPAAVVLATFLQVVLGAWYRHSLRPTPEPTAFALLLVHAAGALLVVVAVLVLAARARTTGTPRVLSSAARRLVVLLVLQIVLGLASYLGYREAAIGPFEWTLSVLHVLVGGLLLVQGSLLWAWSRRLAARSTRHELQPGGVA